MIKASFFYPNKDGAKFDHQYFQETHIGKLVKDRWSPMGMKEFGVEKGLGGGAPVARVRAGFSPLHSRCAAG